MRRTRHSLVICKIFKKAPPLFVIELLCFCIPSTGFNRRCLRILFKGARKRFVYEPPSLRADYPLRMHILEWAQLSGRVFTGEGTEAIIRGQTWGQKNVMPRLYWTHCKQPQRPGTNMEPERGLLGLLGSKIAGGSPESYSMCSMLGILSEIQTLVERSNIINVSIDSVQFVY